MLDVPELPSVIDEVAQGMGPAIDAIYQGWVGNVNKRAGIDLKRDLFGNLGDEYYTATRFENLGSANPLPQNRQLMVISVRDAKALEGALESIKTALMGPTAAQLFQSREYLGTTIHTMVKPQAPNAQPAAAATPAFSYAFTSRYFVLGIGGEDLVETAIQNMKTPLPSYWSRPEVKSALAKLPDGAVGYSYADLPKLVPVYLNMFTQVVQMGGLRVKNGRFSSGSAPSQAAPKEGESADGSSENGSPGDPGKLLIDLTQKPTADMIAKYWGPVVSATYHDATGFYSVARMDHPR